MDSAKSNRKLFTLKILHTVVWAIFVFMIGYILYSGIRNRIDWFTYFSIAAVIVLGIVLLIFKWKCPMTIIAYRYTDSQEVNFDIFLPKIIAKYNKTIFTMLYIIGVVIVIYQKI
jgi:Na+/glutamate symporter